MARSLSSIKVAIKLLATLENAINGAEVFSGEQGLDLVPETRLTSGTGANQADRVWCIKERTLATGSENVDMYDAGALNVGAGAGKDAAGQDVANVEIVTFALYVHPESVGTLLVGGLAAGTAWNSPFNGDDDAKLGPFPAGSIVFIHVPANPALAVADTTNHLLKLEAVGGDVIYSLGYLSRSA